MSFLKFPRALLTWVGGGGERHYVKKKSTFKETYFAFTVCSNHVTYAFQSEAAL